MPDGIVEYDGDNDRYIAYLNDRRLPNLRLKQDVVPGMEQYMWFKARETGSYDIVCAELCGWGHYKMKARATFHSPGEFDAWLNQMTAEQNTRTVAVTETAEE